MDAPGSGSYVLIASADGFQPQASTIVVNGEPVAYDILLSGTSGLSGLVRAAGSGDPVKDAMVIVTDVRGDVLASATTGEQGEFSFAEMVPGSVTIAVNALGHRPRPCPSRSAAPASPGSRSSSAPAHGSRASYGRRTARSATRGSR